MEETAFYDAVSERGDVDPAAADAATLATLSVLGDHLADTVVADLQAPLPDEASEAFAAAADDPPSAFEYETFLASVAGELGVDEAVAERRARAVGATLADRADDDALARAREQLPDEFDRLFWVPAAEEFLETVATADDVESPDEAREAATAVLATLGERVTPGEAADVAAYLPDELASALAPDEDVPPAATGEAPAATDRPSAEDATDAPDTDRVGADYDVDEFVARVAEREGVDAEAARAHVGAVSDALAASLPSREFDDLLDQLPDEYGTVL